MRRNTAAALLAGATALCAPGLLLAQATIPPAADDAEYRGNWGLAMIDALSANKAGFTGKGVVVAIVDTGLDVDHPEFAGRISDALRSFDDRAQTPQDVSHVVNQDGSVEAHGTHVAGIIGAARDGRKVSGEVNMQGVAYEATLLPIQAIGIEPDDPNANEADVAIRYAAAHGAKVLNGSFGPNTLGKYVLNPDGTIKVDANGQWVVQEHYVELDYQPIFDSIDELKETYAAIREAAAKDVVMVFAAGNEYRDQPTASARPDGNAVFPLITGETIANGAFRFVSNYGAKGFDLNDAGTWKFESDAAVADLDFSDLKGSLIAVVAVGQDGKIAPYSNRCGEAAEWCLAAPGGNIDDQVDKGILSTWQATAESGATRIYKYEEGTSMATPHVSGAAAVVRSAFPYMNARQTIETILTTATDLGDEATYGQGLLNVGAAVKGPMELRYRGVFAVDTQGFNSVWSNPISGPGDLTKSGDGILVLAGAGTYTGGTAVTGGTLAVDGSILSATRVGRGGTLAGTGTVGEVTTASGGTVSPGSATVASAATGTLSVGNGLTQRAGSVYRAGLGAGGTSDLLAVAGTATLAEGATLSLVRETTQALTLGTRYTLLTAAGGVIGTFASLTGAAADEIFIDYALGYGASEVYVDVERSDVAFADVARGFSQRSVAAAVEAQAAGAALYDSILPLAAGQAQPAFTALSGEIYPSIRSILTDDSAFLRNAANDRLRAAFGSVGAAAMPVMAFAPGGAVAVAPDTEGTAFWGRAFGAWSRLDGGDAADVDSSTGGFFAGGDMAAGDGWRVGAVAGYSRTSFDSDGVRSSGDSDNTHLGLYAGTVRGPLAFRSAVAATWSRVDADRTVSYAGFRDDLSADFDARTIQAYGEIGYRIDQPFAALEPYANLAYVHLRTDGFDETGGDAALSASNQSSGAAFTTLGLRLGKAVNFDGTTGTLRADLGWRYAFGDVTPEMALAFADGTAFDSRGAPVARNAALVGLGLDLAVNARTTVGFSYQGQFASSVQQNAVTGTVTFRF